MLEFSDQFKIYVIKHKKQVKWSIRISPCSTDLYLLDTQTMDAVLSGWRDRQGKTASSFGQDYFVQHKRVGTPQEYVRLSISGQELPIREYRCTTADMEWLESEYKRQLGNPMPWDLG